MTTAAVAPVKSTDTTGSVSPPSRGAETGEGEFERIILAWNNWEWIQPKNPAGLLRRAEIGPAIASENRLYFISNI